MKLKETHVMRDPVHGYIHIDEDVIWKLIDTPEMQRLRRIHQLGGDSAVYHTADHSRFSHSMGVYELLRRMIEEVPGVKESLSDLEQKAGLCAALLHDVGHGPFSHSYEAISKIRHEEISRFLIESEKTGIHEVLAAEDERLPHMTASILTHSHELPLLEDMVSSQLDCDRMDYLLRDAHETGTTYGSYDLERILRTLRVRDGKLCVKKSGVHAIEDYIMARYQMYWQVYLHPDAASYDLLVHSFFRRYAKIRENPEKRIELLEPVFDDPFDPAHFLFLDDGAVLAGIHQAVRSDDPILSDLAFRVINRRLFEWVDAKDQQTIEALKKKTEEAGFDPEYYFHLKKIRLEEFLPYEEDPKDGTKPILVLDGNSMQTLSEASVVVRALLEMKETEKTRIYLPKSVNI